MKLRLSLSLLFIAIVFGVCSGCVYGVENNTENTKTNDKSNVQIETKQEDNNKLNLAASTDTVAKANTLGNSNTEITPKVNDLQNGRYKIETMDNKTVEVANDGTQNCDNVKVDVNNNSKSEDINLKKVNNDYYTIQFENSGKNLDVQAGQAYNNNNVWQYESNNTDAQLWKVLDYEDYYKVVSKLGNYYLTVSNNNIVIDNRDLGNAQKFRFIRDEKIKSGKTIENGLYQIEISTNSNSVVTAAGGNNCDNVKVSNDNNDKTQRVNITYGNDGYYTISFEQSNKVLDVAAAATTNNSNVWQYESNNTDAQKWSIQKENNSYKIVSKVSNSYLSNVNSNIVINKNNLGSAQLFNLVRVNNVSKGKVLDNGLYQISLSTNSNSVVTVTGNNICASVKLAADNNAQTQRVNITYGNDGYYTISFEQTSKVLDVVAAGTSNNTGVWQYDYNGTNAQKWIFEKVKDNQFRIISKQSGSCLTNSNSNLVVNEKNLGNSQIFNIIRVNNKSQGKVLNNGLYQITLGNNVITTTGNDICAAVKVQGNNNSKMQRVNIVYGSDGYYTISFEQTGKALDVVAAGTTNNTGIWQYNSNGTDAQKWIIEKVKDGQYKIISKRSGSYLTNSNSNLVVNKNNLGNNQIFNIELVNVTSKGKVIKEGIYEIELGTNSNQAMDVINANTNNGAYIQPWVKNNNKAQRVYLEYTKDGYYIFKFQNSGKVLDVRYSDTSNGNKVWQYDYNGTDAQKWIIDKSSNGDYYTIRSKLSNSYLTINTNFEINKASNKSNQLFKFNKTELLGIDVSSHNGTINWDVVKNNVDFAIIRIGYGEDDSNQDDSQFARNISECERLGIPYGVYIYSYALDDAHAQSEVVHTLRLLGGKNGEKHSPVLGVWYDMEDADHYKERSGMPSNEQLVHFCDNYCKKMIENGYKTGIYASLLWFENQLNSNVLDKYDKWVAQWNDKCTYTKKYIMWQYTSDGSVSGINGRVDMNKYYQI